MATTQTFKLRPNGLRLKELRETDLLFTTSTNVLKSNAINIAGCESLTLHVKASVASLVSILDADATAALGVDVPVFTGSSGTLTTKTLDLKTLALNNIIVKIDGQTAPPTLTILFRINSYL